MKRLIFHVQMWNKWRPYFRNSCVYTFRVLFGLTKSPSLEHLKITEQLKAELLIGNLRRK